MPLTWISVLRSCLLPVPNASMLRDDGPYWTTEVWNKIRRITKYIYYMGQMNAKMGHYTKSLAQLVVCWVSFCRTVSLNRFRAVYYLFFSWTIKLIQVVSLYSDENYESIVFVSGKMYSCLPGCNVFVFFAHSQGK